jgi:enoyl-CoA hydratase/carnithine racemase
MLETVQVGPFRYDIVADGVAVVEFDNPPANALAPETYIALGDLITRLESDDRIRVVVLVSGHEKIFASGADLKRFDPETLTPGPIAERVDRAHSAFLRLQRLRKPTIVVIEGFALGGGFELALAADFRIMSRGAARVGLPEARLGLMPSAGGTQRLTRLVGRHEAARLLMLGLRMDAEEAERLGLVTASDDARADALDLAGKLAGMPANSLRGIKASLNYGADGDLPVALAAEREAALQTFTSPEAAEGIAAFVEQRTPKFHE